MSDARRGRWEMVARLALLIGLGLAPWPGLRKLSDGAFCGLANAALRHIEFGDDRALGYGSARLILAERRGETRADDGPQWDARLRLQVSGVSQVQEVYVSPRRTAFVPAWLLLSLVLSAPLSVRRKLCCLAAGIPLVLAAAVAAVATTATWLFSQVPGLVYAGTAAQRTAIELAYRALVVPTANRFILPLLLAIALVIWQFPRTTGAAGTLPSRVSNRAFALPTAGRSRARARRRRSDPLRPKRAPGSP
jgi:hypothetical protein